VVLAIKSYQKKKTCAHRERDGAQVMPKEEKLAF
jgi:hypothetical protein